MKTASVLFTILCLTLVISCDDGDPSGIDMEAHCSDICHTEIECDVVWDTYEECYENCTDSDGSTAYEAFLTSYRECYVEATCEDIQNSEDGCLEAAFVHCVSDATPAHTAYCEKTLECENGQAPTQQELDACLAQNGWETAFLPCVKPAPLAAFASCMENGACSETLYDDCYEAHLN